MRFYLLDKVKDLTPGESATGIKCWSLDNEIFQDHFPGFPTTPGVLLTESMAQLAGILIEHSYYKEYGNSIKVHPVLSIINKAKFRSFVSPGDRCVLQAKLISIDRGRGSASIATYVEEELVCEAVLNFVIAMEGDLNGNPYVKKMDQYFYTILPEEFKP